MEKNKNKEVGQEKYEEITEDARELGMRDQRRAEGD